MNNRDYLNFVEVFDKSLNTEKWPINTIWEWVEQYAKKEQIAALEGIIQQCEVSDASGGKWSPNTTLAYEEIKEKIKTIRT